MHLIRVKGKPCGLNHLVDGHLGSTIEEEEKDAGGGEGDGDKDGSKGKMTTWVLQASSR